MKLISQHPLAGAVAMATACCISAGAQAQNKLALEEVVVTAQKREQSLEDVPIAVQALSGDSLKQNGITGLSDISVISPGVNIVNTQSSFNTAAIRGVNSFAFGYGLEESVPFYLDGIYLGNGFAMLGDLQDVQQIEVLKGPQGTLFGRNASGGAINVLSKRPVDELEGNVEVGAGNYDLRTVSGVLNVPVLDDTLLLRGGFSTRDRDGWQTNVVTGREDGFAQDRWSGFVKALWLASDTVEVAFNSDWSRQQDHSGYKSANAVRPGIWQGIYAQADPEHLYDEDRKFAAGDDSFTLSLPDGQGGFISVPIAPAGAVPIDQNRKIRGNSLTITWDISPDVTLTSLSSYRQVDSFAGTDADSSDLGLVNSFRSGSTRELNQELRLNVVGESVDWFVGANAYRQDRDEAFFVSASSLVSLSRLGPQGLGTRVDETSAGDSKTESYALFGDATWHVTPRVNLTAGLRYSYDAKSFDLADAGNDTFNGGGILFPNPDQMADPGLASLHDNWSNISGRLVADYQLNDNTMVYASVSQGYKSGGFNTTLTVEGNPVGGFTTPAFATQPFDEETNINYEVGIKGDLMDGRLRFNSSLYEYRYQDLQILVGDSSSPVARTVNASEVTGRGWEADLTFLATEGLTLYANIALMDVKYSDDVLDAEGTLRTESGTERPWAPEFSGTVSLDYETPLADLGTLRANLSYNYKGAHYQRSIDVTEDIPSSANEQEAYGIVNARLSFYSPGENWELALWGKNLADEYYRGFINGSALSTAGMLQVVPGEPRTYGLEATYNF